MQITYFLEQQYKEFKENGFVRIPKMVPDTLLQKLRDFFNEVEAETEDEIKTVYEKNGVAYVTNMDLLCAKKNMACVELLGSPFLLQIAQAICGPDFFPIQEFAVIKNAGDELPVLWHQDMRHERKGDCFTVGIYLDEAICGDGALKVVPGSHLMQEEICTISNLPFLEVAMQPGDILVHDMMLAHSSDPIRINKKRRVIYFEFLSAKHVAVEQIYSKELVENRTDLLNVALAYYRNQNPDADHFIWEFENANALQNETQLRDRIAKIYAMPIQAKASAYCLESSKRTIESA